MCSAYALAHLIAYWKTLQVKKGINLIYLNIRIHPEFLVSCYFLQDGDNDAGDVISARKQKVTNTNVHEMHVTSSPTLYQSGYFNETRILDYLYKIDLMSHGASEGPIPGDMTPRPMALSKGYPQLILMHAYLVSQDTLTVVCSKFIRIFNKKHRKTQPFKNHFGCQNVKVVFTKEITFELQNLSYKI